MKTKITNEFDYENEELRFNHQLDDPDPKETPKPGEDDGSVGTDDDETDEGVVKPYN